MTVWVGTSGWQYPSWRGRLYPKGLPTKRWLSHYASAFPTVEVNASFYRLPRPEAVKGWRDTVAADFLFAVKASRYLTHVRRLQEPCGRPRPCYRPQALTRWADRIAAWAGRGDVYVYFNNDPEGCAVEDARTMMRRLDKRGVEVARTAGSGDSLTGTRPT